MSFTKPFLTIKEIKQGIAAKKFSPKEVVDFHLDRIKKFNPQLNAVLETFEDEAATQTQNDKGLLAHVPGLIKDNISQKGRLTTAGSNVLKGYKAPYNATIVDRLQKQGGLLIGRTNMDEFAMGSSGEFSTYGATRNPWDLTRSPGGSSSGSGAAVSAGLVPWAIGSETGGSVRQPAAFGGLVGLYPTYGLFSRYGILPFASSLDQVGPITRTVYDCALVTSAMSGHDQNDSTSIPEPAHDYTINLNGKLPAGLRIGVIKDALTSEGINPEIKQKFLDALKELEKLGATIKEIELPNLKYGISVYFLISRAEAASNLARFDGSLYGNRALGIKTLEEMAIQTRTQGFGTEVKKRIMMGNYVLSQAHRSEFYEKALHVRSMIRAEFEQAFAEVDVLTSPTTTTLPFELGKDVTDPLAIYMNDYFSVPSNVAGLPGISIPCGYSQSGLPIGFQLIGPRLSEDMLFQVAHAYEQETQFFTMTPKGFE